MNLKRGVIYTAKYKGKTIEVYRSSTYPDKVINYSDCTTLIPLSDIEIIGEVKG